MGKSRKARRIGHHRLLLTSALVPVLAVSGLVIGATPSHADGGRGGQYTSGGPPINGGAGGTSNATTAGGAGGDGTYAPYWSGGGGGGAGATGGAGGKSEGGTSAAGGASAGQDGADAPDMSSGSGGGGGGGAHGYVGSTAPTAAVQGGKGGDGGSSSSNGSGGGGGAGGYGAVITGSGPLTILYNVVGGNGGAGGSSSGSGFSAGAGGQGGYGILTTTATTLTIGSGVVVVGGNGVAGGTGAGGGVGIAGSDLNLILQSGAIVSGGVSSSSVQADAIQLTGGTSVLELEGNGSMSLSTPSYASIIGNVVGATGGASNTLKFSGSGGLFNLANLGNNNSTYKFQNFTGYDVSTTGTWSFYNNSQSGLQVPWVVSAGTLRIGRDGDSASYTIPGTVRVKNGGTLAGSPTGSAGGGTNGYVVVESGGHLKATQYAGSYSINVNGELALASGAILDVTLGAPNNTYAIFNTTSNLTLNGTLNVSSGTSFGVGDYLIIGYSGVLSGSGLVVGSMPSGYDATISTMTANKVLLTVTVAQPLYWNGTTTSGSGPVAGGDGTWTASQSQLNWTNAAGTSHVASNSSKVAAFAGTAGTVTVDTTNGAVGATGLTFISSGYVVAGDDLTLANGSATPAVNVDGAGTTATISSSISGSDGLEKTGAGTLVLSGANTYTGGTTVTDGTLQLGDATGVGSVVGNIVDNAALVFANPTAQTFAGVVSGSGTVTKQGAGTLTLTANNTYTGTTTISAGTLQIRDGGSTGSVAGAIVNNAALVLN
ncbi:autotransporter-associated beta strand repeat-containing protein, partial [Pseudoxanthobacter soli]